MRSRANPGKQSMPEITSTTLASGTVTARDLRGGQGAAQQHAVVAMTSLHGHCNQGMAVPKYLASGGRVFHHLLCAILRIPLFRTGTGAHHQSQTAVAQQATGTCATVLHPVITYHAKN